MQPAYFDQLVGLTQRTINDNEWGPPTPLPPSVDDAVQFAQSGDSAMSDRSVMMGNRAIVWGAGASSGPNAAPAPEIYSTAYLRVAREDDASRISPSVLSQIYSYN